MAVCLCNRPTSDAWVTLLAALPKELSVVWDAVCERIQEQADLHPDRPVRNGQVIEILCASYLAG